LRGRVQRLFTLSEAKRAGSAYGSFASLRMTLGAGTCMATITGTTASAVCPRRHMLLVRERVLVAASQGGSSRTPSQGQ
jgi:hypothetical protein